MASDKKRKRDSEASTSHNRPSKKPTSKTTDTVKIRHVRHANELPPVLAVPFGGRIPESIPLRPYTRIYRPEVPIANREMLLHSSTHPRLDYTADEDFGTGSDALGKHYIGIFDAGSGEMKLMPVRKVAMRTILRPTQAELDAEKEDMVRSVSLAPTATSPLIAAIAIVTT